MNKYCNSLTKYSRLNTYEVNVGSIKIGGNARICLQTMTNTRTSDIKATVEQVIRAYKAGSELVRITAPSIHDVDYLRMVKEELAKLSYAIPLVADIHFNQKIAFEAAKVVEKVRINPGNFADSKKFDKHDYTEDEYQTELRRVEKDFIPLIHICKDYNTSLRIGTNHGSLSDRIMSRFGDTPEGMVESAMEFLRICKRENFNRVVISMKASNTLIMVQATRLLVSRMMEESMNYPLHLGVTEAGEGEDGRIKSAVGIGALLNDGIGDTIRVSLTEQPENEIPVAKKLADYYAERNNHESIPAIDKNPVNPFVYTKRKTADLGIVGGNNLPVVLAANETEAYPKDLIPDIIIKDTSAFLFNEKDSDQKKTYPVFYSNDKLPGGDKVSFLIVDCKQLDSSYINLLKEEEKVVLVLQTSNKNGFADQRAAVIRLINSGIQAPVILKRTYSENDLETLQVKAAADLGGLFIDGLADGVWIENMGNITQAEVVSVAFGILQACRLRMTKPDYISCPSCGRTMFDLQKTTREIRERTSHLKGLKIGIMGCIVNGLGEMADADYGYIGSGKGKVNLYFNKELVKRGIAEADAVNELVELIKEKGDWIDPTN
ncbi:MAG: (E)-4-hydroxy-3-methylbut-2-enyl-diphosphate synthase [Bacteroidales bacterium]|nr:(E)-4-hydroxy-3-methylbut-2-enyl-diphosphate synthase [Bacteroidales bacterium]MBN2820806.1 (E)-4-hydroxy-3-methylbut-2-enyl-diphosphate synthase [Bacteroidales bacterium]